MTLRKRVSVHGSMYLMVIGLRVWMILIGLWEVAAHRVGKRDRRVITRLDPPSVGLKWLCKRSRGFRMLNNLLLFHHHNNAQDV